MTNFNIAEEFNKKIMNEISEEDMKSLHEDATNLFNLHFKADADHKVSVSPHLVDEIKQSELFWDFNISINRFTTEQVVVRGHIKQ